MTQSTTPLTSQSVQLGSPSPWKKYTAGGPMAVPTYPTSLPTQMVPGLAGPLAPPVPGPQFTHIPAGPFTSPMPFTSPIAPTMTMMPSYIPPGFPTQIPWQMPAGAGPFQGAPLGAMGYPGVQGMPTAQGVPAAATQGVPWGAGFVPAAATQGVPWGAGFVPAGIPQGFPKAAPTMPAAAGPYQGAPLGAIAAPTQLSGAVPGVTAAPVAGISPGGFPLPTMPGFPVPGGTAPTGFPNLQMTPAPTQQAVQGIPAPGSVPAAAAQGFPTAMPTAAVQGFPKVAPVGAVQGYPTAPTGALQGFPAAVPDAQRLSLAVLQQPAFQATLGGWANAWLDSPEFKARLIDVLKAPDLQEAIRKNALGAVQDTAFLQEVAKRVSEQAKG